MMALVITGCKNELPPNEEVPGVDDGFWQGFYQSSEKRRAISESATYVKASYGYIGEHRQGFNRWYYYAETDGAYSELPFDEARGQWTDGAVTLADRIMQSGGASRAARGFKSTVAGRATLCGKIAAPTDTGASFSIFVNERQVYPREGRLEVPANDANGVYFSAETDLGIGDMVYFVVSGKAECNPTIRYGDYKEILYQVPDWNFYGDVHPFFHNGKMYMYNLQGYLEDVGNERYMWCLHTSTDMFNYVEEDYYVPEFVTNHYNATIDVYESIFDKETFPYGSRDMFLFYDHIAEKYVYFGLCYYEDMSSCLGCRVSDDDSGTKWSTPMFSIRDFPYQRDPECSQAMFINDRWYLITSVWGESIHSVGRPAYLIGDKGKAFLDNDWSNKEMHYLDGEDLCAAQLVCVGEGKWLMYGWIPKTSYSNTGTEYFDGTRDHGLWGGNINVAREVYQKADGTLATRLDDRMSELLSRGSLYASKTVTDKEAIGTFDRTYVTYDFEVANASTGTKVSYVMKAGDKTYRVTAEQRNDGAYMSVSCREDKGHPVASQMRIGDTLVGKHSVRIVIDRSVCEFFLDDQYSLTARTSLFGGAYTASVETGTATVSNLSVNKLAHCGDVYD